MNDGDPNGDPIPLVDGDPSVPGIQPVSGPAHGSAELPADGTFHYQYDNEGNMVTKTEIVAGTRTEYTCEYRK